MEMRGSIEIPEWLSRVILKQERRLRKEYEEEYVCKCKETGIAPLRYAPWRGKKPEPIILEILLEECGTGSRQEV